MNVSKRTLPAFGFAALLLGCTALTPGASLTVEQVISNTQAVLSYLGPIVPLLAAFVPGAAAFVPVAQAALGDALNIFGTISSGMTVAAAQPVVGKVTTALQTALDSARQAIGLIPGTSQRAQAAAIMDEAQTILNLLKAFAAGVVATLTPSARAVIGGNHLYIRQAR